MKATKGTSRTSFTFSGFLLTKSLVGTSLQTHLPPRRITITILPHSCDAPLRIVSFAEFPGCDILSTEWVRGIRLSLCPTQSSWGRRTEFFVCDLSVRTLERHCIASTEGMIVTAPSVTQWKAQTMPSLPLAVLCFRLSLFTSLR